MLFLIEQWESVRDFIAAGGDVLYVVALALFLMWAFMIERFWYLSLTFTRQALVGFVYSSVSPTSLPQNQICELTIKCRTSNSTPPKYFGTIAMCMFLHCVHKLIELNAVVFRRVYNYYLLVFP